ncbi:sigma-70 family RNA polymerase sigma factor [Thiomonas sp.]
MAPTELFHANTKLVPFIVRRYRSACESRQDWEDMMQWGFLGLWKAASGGFDERKGAFTTYACRAISNECKMFIRRNEVVQRLEVVSLDAVPSEGNASAPKVPYVDRLAAPHRDPDFVMDFEAAFRGLPANQRRLLTANYMGYRNTELRHVAGSTSRCVNKVHVSRVKQAAQRAMRAAMQ